MIFMPAHVVDFYQECDRMIHRQRVDVWQEFASGVLPGATIPVNGFSVGDATYRLRRPVQGYFMRQADGSCLFLVDGFNPTFVGKGERARDAYDNWRDLLHEVFQTLYGKRQFEMTDEERDQWSVLDGMIDVVSYRNETPLVVRQVGCVSGHRTGQPMEITWVDGRKERVCFSQMPPEFAGYQVGQYFEADVEREPLSGRLNRVRHVQRIHSLRPLTGSQLEEFWDSLPGTDSLPRSNRDWTQG
jgi:hypothetical protein